MRRDEVIQKVRQHYRRLAEDYELWQRFAGKWATAR
jgi:hypothetical protein